MTKTPGGFFIANTATLCGDVTVGELSSFWFSAVCRGDVDRIVIGKRVNVQDCAVIHCDAFYSGFKYPNAHQLHRSLSPMKFGMCSHYGSFVARLVKHFKRPLFLSFANSLEIQIRIIETLYLFLDWQWA